MHMLTSYLSFLAVHLQGTQVFWVPHSCTFTPCFPPSSTRSLCPQADPDCLARQNTGSQPRSLRQMCSHKASGSIHLPLVVTKINPSLKKMCLVMKAFTLQTTATKPPGVSLLTNVKLSVSPTAKQTQLGRGEAQGQKPARDREKGPALPRRSMDSAAGESTESLTHLEAPTKER